LGEGTCCPLKGGEKRGMGRNLPRHGGGFNWGILHHKQPLTQCRYKGANYNAIP